MYQSVPLQLLAFTAIQWRTQNFRMGGVDVLQGWAREGSIPLPIGEGFRDSPLPRKFFVFFVENTIF